jgi:Uma2 family endonuclease
MYTAEKKHRLTEDEYFAYEETIEGWAEYYNGEIFDMAGGSENHNLIAQNLSAEFRSRFRKGSCRAYSGDFRLRIDESNDNVRPDVWVICGKTERHKDRSDTAKNPLMVAEVQSKSTTKFDHGGKFDRYFTIPGFQEYVLIEQDVPQVDLYFRNPQGFVEFTRVTDPNGEVFFKSLGFAVPMAEIYLNVDFDAEEEA